MTKENKKDYGKSIHDRLLNISKEQNIVFMQIATRYFQERLLYRLSVSRFRDKFLLKGGALLYVYDFLTARPTLDIDLLGNGISNDIPNIKDIFAEIISIEEVTDGVTFNLNTLKVEELMVNKKYKGVRISMEARMHSMRTTMTVDIGFGDKVTPFPIQIEYPKLLSDKPSTHLLAYSIETVIAKKFDAMISLGENNSRMKDFFDVYRFIKNYNIDTEVLAEAIKNTFENRKTAFQDNHALFSEGFRTDLARQMRWKGFLKKMKFRDDLNFEEVVKTVTDYLYPYWLKYNAM